MERKLGPIGKAMVFLENLIVKKKLTQFLFAVSSPIKYAEACGSEKR